MPIYEYRCEACGAELEAIQKMSDAPLKFCSACGKETLQRVISLTSFHLKGSGWYVTDYKSKGSGGKSDGGDKPSAGTSKAD